MPKVSIIIPNKDSVKILKNCINSILKLTTYDNYEIVIVENNRLDDLQYQVEPTEHHEKRITAKFICDRGVSHK